MVIKFFLITNIILFFSSDFLAAEVKKVPIDLEKVIPLFQSKDKFIPDENQSQKISAP
jgi:hypothetical protein